jgi:hypothetical protein
LQGKGLIEMDSWRHIEDSASAGIKATVNHPFVALWLAITTLLGGCNPFIQKNPQLCALVDTDRTVLFSNQTPGLLKLSVGDIVVKNDVSKATIFIWNQGNTPIRNTNTQSNMLDQFLIQTVGDVPILDASVLNQTRGVIGFRLLKDQMRQGHLSAMWNTLEKEDGVRLQVIYAGPPETRFSVKGTPELQTEGTITYLNKSYLDSASIRWVYNNPVILWGLFLLIIFVLSWVVYTCWWSARESTGASRLAFVLFFPLALIYLLDILAMFLLAKVPNMPYGI